MLKPRTASRMLSIIGAAAVLIICGASACSQRQKLDAPIRVKVVIVAMFERGEDTGDSPGEYQYWVEREHLEQIFPMPAGYHHVRMNKDGVLGLLTGVGTAKAAASVMALGLDPRFDLSKAYWIVAGIGGGAPSEVSLGSAVWVDRVVDGDLAFEIDGRQIPENWSTGYVPLGKSMPFEPPMDETRAGIFTLNQELTAWADSLTQDLSLADSDDLKKYRARFAGFPNALRPPFVTRGGEITSSTFWHGSKMEQWAKEWVRYYTAGKGNYVVCGMEDSGTLQSLAFLNQAARVDFERVLVLRTVSNYDREPPGVTAADSLKSLAAGNYSAYLPSLDAAEKVGDKVVREILTHWRERETKLPHVR
jgi:purine nucleoside permease